MTHIDLNSDVGESFGRWELGDDDAVLEVVTSANVACGFHAGDPSTLARTCRSALANGVRIGAQVSYRDLAGFGRRFVDATQIELTDDVVYQIGGLQAIARAAGGTVSYVKPHGALYNTAVHHDVHARAVVEAIAAVDPHLPVLGLPGSRLLEIARDRGIPTVREAFADRAYHSDGTLVSRREPGAVLDDPAVVAGRVMRMVSDGVVDSIDGDTIRIDVDSVCLHGDSPAAVAMAVATRELLTSEGIEITPFT
ncbi:MULTISPECIES: LamB/YcsF family protein [Gordonia]|uniref:5-oxoprolinase subunit A n=1 Tax=Gordonia sputi NBRC 100414 TaxID=1089453 RepID=H5TVD7_9ACTN|nr:MULTISPECIES: 5-oxoprolinase subunit PxpA [Gordonia]NKY93146.1 LamB/YcsF family protein [Gordonia sputi]OBC07124.1 hypothetical protein A5785_07790 [Gordonia sp. 852002-50395_SCH5434458]GAB37445.1 hypothetical protein GOSPT_007_00560 [Gordonia sputi NBRC 100414]